MFSRARVESLKTISVVGRAVPQDFQHFDVFLSPLSGVSLVPGSDYRFMTEEFLWIFPGFSVRLKMSLGRVQQWL